MDGIGNVRSVDVKKCKEHNLSKPCIDCVRADRDGWKQSYRLEHGLVHDLITSLIEVTKRLRKYEDRSK